ncbi:hypothetical protein U728_1522 [Clostridium botulinum 202F]|nr:hypothetical protein U728_1522 [Clostridium botulinum 202F]KAI3346719.1 hypothetical protein CIT17_07055 [Clostridium botulinum]KON13928.1 hypothetical protein ACP50_07660 [Clostridium botulinum]MBY6987495.1 hypothetical protein [Clostridium botulinum]NFG99968.1 hypothetical protein [Clostridium botulinum]
MEGLIDRFTLECRTNKSGKLKRFRPNNIKKETYKLWKADSNVMIRDAILANKIGISYPRQLEMIHGTIERILKSFVIKEYGIELLIHETITIYNSIKCDLGSEISQGDYAALKLLDNNFILHRYSTENRFYSEDMIDMGFEVLINVNSLVEEALNLSNRAKRAIKEVEDEISFDIQDIKKEGVNLNGEL